MYERIMTQKLSENLLVHGGFEYGVVEISNLLKASSSTVMGK